jgi:hypothetical protein
MAAKTPGSSIENRRGPHPLQDGAVEGRHLVSFLVLVAGQGDLHGQELLGLEAGVHPHEPGKALDQQPGPYQQHQGYPDLGGDQPRDDYSAVLPTINRINANLANMADGRSIPFVDINDRLADDSGTLLEGMTVDGLHLSPKGDEVRADLRPILVELLGSPAATDHAPPPTGDPSAAARSAP